MEQVHAPDKHKETRIQNIQPLILDLLKDEETFHSFFRMNTAILLSVTAGGRKNMKTKHQLQEGDFT